MKFEKVMWWIWMIIGFIAILICSIKQEGR